MPNNGWIQLNFKTPAGSLFNIYADNKEDLDFGIETLSERMGTIGELEALIGAVSAAASTPASNGYNGGGQAAQQPQVPAQRQYGGGGGGGYGGGGGIPRPGGPAPLLPNGQEADWKSGTSKATGKPYGGWYDPASKSFLR